MATLNFEAYAIGAKIQAYDKDGYFVMPLCGTIESHLGGGHAIIKSFDGSFYSTLFTNKVAEIEPLN